MESSVLEHLYCQLPEFIKCCLMNIFVGSVSHTWYVEIQGGGRILF